MLYFLLNSPIEQYSFETLPMDYEIIQFSKNETFYKMKQIILSTCDKNEDILIFLFENHNYFEKQLIDFLYKAEFRYTGAYPWNYRLFKDEIKKICSVKEILTPKYSFIYDLKNIENETKHLSFPLFIKPESGANNVFSNYKSKVDNCEDLAIQANYILHNYGGVLMEDFIEGRQFSLLIFGNKDEFFVLDPMECVFHLDKKEHYHKKVEDVKIINECKEVTSDFFTSMDTKGYFKIDLKYKEGKCHFLRINSHPMLFRKEHSVADKILKINDVNMEEFIQIMIDISIKKEN